MAIDLNDEILQDFLVEAGEILELLSEQLVEMENNPDDLELLNAVFRGFHTVKGGAGFLNLTAMVAIAHNTEDLFNHLRQGDLQINASLMDAVLQSLDVINRMFDDVKAGNDPEPASDDLLQLLVDVAAGKTEPDAADENILEAEVVPGVDDVTDDEFNSMLDVLGGSDTKPDEIKVPTATAQSDDITDDEFDDLLDQIHGKGQHGSIVPTNSETIKDEPVAVAAATVETVKAKAGGGEYITDDEFDSLLDQLHGKGKGPTAQDSSDESQVVGASSSNNVPSNTNSSKPVAKLKSAAKAVATADSGKKGAAPAASQADTTVRVDTKRLDDIMNLVGELVLARNRLSSLKDTFDNEDMAQAVANLAVVTSDLQGAVMKTRMQPVKKVFGRFPRVVRDLARSLKKEVQLVLHGEETDLDKNLVEALADPLVHLVRNSVDHGIEQPEEREAAGKDRCGTVILSAEQEGDHILLTISDDGKGMEPDNLRAMAVRKGIMDEEAAARLTNKECFDLIFLPGTSTKEIISDVSGRGVGMDVVKTRIAQLNGTIDIDSKVGRGTTLSIKVPLTLAILPTLMVVIGERMFALPLSIVNEIFELESKQTNVVDGQTVVHNRGKAPPLFFLNKWLPSSVRSNSSIGKDGQVIMVQIGNLTAGFVVDLVVGQEEVVIKPLGYGLQGSPGLAGATITGNGDIALILDMPSLLKANSALIR